MSGRSQLVRPTKSHDRVAEIEGVPKTEDCGENVMYDDVGEKWWARLQECLVKSRGEGLMSY